MAEKGYIPESWLLDLYGLADAVRKQHKNYESALAHLKTQLNMPDSLAQEAAKDVLDEIVCTLYMCMLFCFHIDQDVQDVPYQ